MKIERDCVLPVDFGVAGDEDPSSRRHAMAVAEVVFEPTDALLRSFVENLTTAKTFASGSVLDLNVHGHSIQRDSCAQNGMAGAAAAPARSHAGAWPQRRVATATGDDVLVRHASHCPGRHTGRWLTQAAGFGR